MGTEKAALNAHLEHCRTEQEAHGAHKRLKTSHAPLAGALCAPTPIPSSFWRNPQAENTRTTCLPPGTGAQCLKTIGKSSWCLKCYGLFHTVAHAQWNSENTYNCSMNQVVSSLVRDEVSNVILHQHLQHSSYHSIPFYFFLLFPPQICLS